MFKTRKTQTFDSGKFSDSFAKIKPQFDLEEKNGLVNRNDNEVLKGFLFTLPITISLGFIVIVGAKYLFAIL